MRRRSILSATTCLLLCGIYGIVGVPSALEPFRALPPNQQMPAPAFTLPDYRGTPVHSADLRGKVVVVRFWATW